MLLDEFVSSLRFILRAHETDAYRKRARFKIFLFIWLMLIMSIIKNQTGMSKIYFSISMVMGVLILEFVFRLYIYYFVKRDN